MSEIAMSRFEAVKKKLLVSADELALSAKERASQIQTGFAKGLQTYVIGPMEKGFEAARIETPPSHVVDGVDLRVLPKYISYKAALLREKISLQYALALITGAFLIFFVTSRIEVSHLNSKLREKEYILAPGVQDFTPVSPQSVPDSHVQNAAMEFLQNFGTFNPVNIAEQYSSQLRVDVVPFVSLIRLF